jgi:hypothetical protein
MRDYHLFLGKNEEIGTLYPLKPWQPLPSLSLSYFFCLTLAVAQVSLSLSLIF